MVEESLEEVMGGGGDKEKGDCASLTNVLHPLFCIVSHVPDP